MSSNRQFLFIDYANALGHRQRDKARNYGERGGGGGGNWGKHHIISYQHTIIIAKTERSPTNSQCRTPNNEGAREREREKERDWRI